MSHYSQEVSVSVESPEWLAEYTHLFFRMALESHPRVSRDFAAAEKVGDPAAAELLEEHQRWSELYARVRGLSQQEAQSHLDASAEALRRTRQQAETAWNALAVGGGNLKDMALEAEHTAWLLAYSLASHVSGKRALFRLLQLAWDNPRQF
ncbi:MAG TPA: hypothetical protein VFO38_04695 [Candidatus Saccharimonadales bacterium]|nr:hypothetical protein [Candidatus Saccharimonadales bacterium]